MSRFPTEPVILLFSTIAHVVLHFIQQPNNHPFVRPGGHTGVAMPYAERNAGNLQQNFQRERESRDCCWKFVFSLCRLEWNPDSRWWRGGAWGVEWHFDSERDLWSRAAIVLSPPCTCYHSNREDPSVTRVVLVVVVLVGGVFMQIKKNGSDERERGSTWSAALYYLRADKQKIEDFRCLAMDVRACVEWRGESDSSFRLVAMAPPEALGRNGG